MVPEAEIVALADPDANSLARFIADVFPDQAAPPTFDDYQTMLAEVPLDGVVIVSPHAYHFVQAMDALSAGCHVLVEKPMVIRSADAQTLIAHARAHNRAISVAFPGPFTCEFQYIRNLIVRGDLGDIYLITGMCSQPVLEQSAAPGVPRMALSGGGNLYDSGAHMFNAMLYLTGLSARRCSRLLRTKGTGSRYGRHGGDTLTKGALGSAAVSGATTVFEQGIYIHGTRARSSAASTAAAWMIGSARTRSSIRPCRKPARSSRISSTASRPRDHAKPAVARAAPGAPDGRDL